MTADDARDVLALAFNVDLAPITNAFREFGEALEELAPKWVRLAQRINEVNAAKAAHQARHHQQELPSRSALHRAYRQRQLARRRRNRR